jgi:hypothetical protein
MSTVNGISAKWGVAITTGNAITGLVSLDSTNSVSTFTVVSDNFYVSLPSHASGAAIPVFAIGMVNGVARISLRADVIADGSIAARTLSVVSLSAISADLGTVTAGLLKDPANLYQFQVANGWWGKTDGSSFIDMKNGVFQFTSVT